MVQTMQKISQGAEAVIFLDNSNKWGEEQVVKQRTEKTYRHALIDSSLRSSRTRREAKILDKLQKLGFRAPRLFDSCDSDMKINMQFIAGEKLRDTLHKDHIAFSKEIGKMAAMLHDNDIIHGDLTTSNMILNEKDNPESIYFIDFGLSSFSKKIEDKAVDLHLFKRALDSKHYEIADECFEAALDEYAKNCKSTDSRLVLERLRAVEMRGRNKKKR